MNFPDANRIDVEEVARVSAAVERAELVAHGVLETEYRADGQHSRLGLAPVHAHVNVDLMAVGSCHFKASELVDAAQLRDVVAGLAQAKYNGVDGGRKARQVDIGREQVDVLGWAVDEAVLADGTGPGEYEAGSVEGPESHAGYLPLRIFGVAHTVAASSGNRLSHRFRTRLDKINSGHNSRRSERLRIVTWSATMPSEMVAW